MLSQLEELEKGKTKEEEGNPVQETTQEQSQIYAAQSAVKCNSTAEAGSGGASMAAAAQASQKRPSVWSRLGRAEAGGGSASMPAAAQASQKRLPCYFAASFYCHGMTLVDEDGRSVKKCPMWAQDKCPQPHDAATCKSAYAGDEGFRSKLAHYMEVAKANSNKVPSKEQLQDAGVLPKWVQERTVHSSKGTGGCGLGGCAQGRGKGIANTSGGGGPSSNKVKFDPARAVVVFAGRSQGHQMAALDPKDVPLEGARTSCLRATSFRVIHNPKTAHLTMTCFQRTRALFATTPWFLAEGVHCGAQHADLGMSSRLGTMLLFSDFEPRALIIGKESSFAHAMTGSAYCLLAKPNLLLFAQSICVRFPAHRFIEIDLKSKRRATCMARQIWLCLIRRMCRWKGRRTSRLRAASFQGLARLPAWRTAEGRRRQLMAKLISMCRRNSHSRKS